ncbi:TetR/AcrR family transcriptional regulator [Acidocella aminolytica]|uniref:Transcriptional regulator TetR n=1 Tax=Acidocella aminolytica 101 = DSM 11237 TaxID=1120923 RepID=A0A0D6PG53_9PROT|nr:TetR/AcrR family transcriptional regulator [Acidocella aminolytica]GAN80356.1 transcriptional regulator TetR [Acidocella aminolytica 101 = DSM 11237]GBQ42924.1 transcriptional regulator [Acidocella aminolytica 101 = DSM 11237]SHE29456.1 transcriptional regulator, TetR family [Acidocella aminolytica 101 = DSM 11237]
MRRKTETRRFSFVEAARKLFVAQGFGAVTMEAIAAEAGASKATLYGYFSGKEALFEAFVVEAGEGGIAALDASREESDVRSSLVRLGVAYLDLVTRPEVMAVHRLIIGESGRHPQLVRIFYENGPRLTLLSVCGVIDRFMDEGFLRRAEPRKAGLNFQSLCDAAGQVGRQLWGLDKRPDAKTRKAAAEEAVDIFLAAYLH